jgi:nucleotide-binding universal stress UspA family protein
VPDPDVVEDQVAAGVPVPASRRLSRKHIPIILIVNIDLVVIGSHALVMRTYHRIGRYLAYLLLVVRARARYRELAR